MEELLFSKIGPEQQNISHFICHRQINSLQVKKTHEMGILCLAIVMIDTFSDDRNVDGLI